MNGRQRLRDEGQVGGGWEAKGGRGDAVAKAKGMISCGVRNGTKIEFGFQMHAEYNVILATSASVGCNI